MMQVATLQVARLYTRIVVLIKQESILYLLFVWLLSRCAPGPRSSSKWQPPSQATNQVCAVQQQAFCGPSNWEVPSVPGANLQPLPAALPGPQCGPATAPLQPLFSGVCTQPLAFHIASKSHQRLPICGAFVSDMFQICLPIGCPKGPTCGLALWAHGSYH